MHDQYLREEYHPAVLKIINKQVANAASKRNNPPWHAANNIPMNLNINSTTISQKAS
jgi:hypothetical protein